FKAQVNAASLQQSLTQLPPVERAKVRSIALGSLSDGVEIRLSIEGNPPETERIAKELSQPLVDSANAIRPGRLQIASYRLDITPPYPLQQPSLFPVLSIATLLLALLLLLILWLRERMQGNLPMPRLQGIPLLGTLPKGMTELRCDPCLALGAMFLMAVRSAKRGEIAVVSESGEAIVAACIGQALTKAGHRVLIVDRFGEKSALPELFRESERSEKKESEGNPEKRMMDILTIKHEQGVLPLPANLRENYDWIVYFVPGFLPGKKTVGLVDRAPIGLSLLKLRILALLNRSPLTGLVLLGLRPPSDTLSRYQLRCNFERLRRLDSEA
ncbi:MAG TPA: hypothetical protein V6C82_06205, partial [Chroococcales cyanobacterium]